MTLTSVVFGLHSKFFSSRFHFSFVFFSVPISTFMFLGILHFITPLFVISLMDSFIFTLRFLDIVTIAILKFLSYVLTMLHFSGPAVVGLLSYVGDTLFLLIIDCVFTLVSRYLGLG